MLTAKQCSGRLLELAVAEFMRKNHVPYSHNKLDDSNYPLGEGKRIDGIIKNESGQDILIEITNPKASTWMTDDIMQKKLGYYTWIDKFHTCLWLLIVSHANYSQAIKQQINQHGIQVIELKTTATRHNLSAIIHSLYHSMIYRIIKSLNTVVSKRINNDNLHRHREYRELEDDIPLEQLRAWIQYLKTYVKDKKERFKG